MVAGSSLMRTRFFTGALVVTLDPVAGALVVAFDPVAGALALAPVTGALAVLLIAAGAAFAVALRCTFFTGFAPAARALGAPSPADARLTPPEAALASGVTLATGARAPASLLLSLLSLLPGSAFALIPCLPAFAAAAGLDFALTPAMD